MKKFNLFDQIVALWCAALMAVLPFLAFSNARAVVIESLPNNMFFNYKIKVTYQDLASAASSTASNLTLQIFPASGLLPAGFTVFNAGYSLVTAFDTAGTDTSGISLGDSNDTDRLIVVKEVASDATEILYWVTANVTDTLPFTYVTATNLTLTLTNGNGNLIDAFTQGEIHFFIGTDNMVKLARD